MLDMAKANSEIITAADEQCISLKIGKMDTADMRKRYLSKLTYHQVWLSPLKQPKTHQNLIIFDWDDTLLCTGLLNPNDEAQMESVVQKFKKELILI